MTVILIPLAIWFCNSSLSTMDLILPQTRTVHTWIFIIHCTGQVKVIGVKEQKLILAPVTVPAISYTGSSCDVEHATVNIFVSWGFTLTQLPCFEHYQFICSHYSPVGAHITVTINYQEQQMQALSRTVCFVKCCKLKISEEDLESKHASYYPTTSTVFFVITTFYWKKQLLSDNCGTRSLTGSCSWNSALDLQILWRDPGCSRAKICHSYVGNTLLLVT